VEKADNQGRELSKEEEQEWQRLDSAQSELEHQIKGAEETKGDYLYSADDYSQGDLDIFKMESKNKTKGWAPSHKNIKVASEPEDRFVEDRKKDGVMLGTYIRWVVNGPANQLEEKAYRSISGLAGGTAKNTIPEELSNQLIDLLRAQTVIGRSGAVYMTMDTNNYHFAKMTGDVPAAWRNELDSLGTGDPTFTRVPFGAKNLGGMVRMSRELFDDNTVGLDQAILRSFAGKFAVEFDKAVLVGTGSDRPNGISTYTNAQVIDKGTNGGSITNYSDIVRAYRLLYDSNFGNPTAAIMSPREWETFTNLVDANGNPLMMPRDIQNLPWLSSTSMPTNLDAGTSTGVASQIFIGDFSNLIVAMRQEVTMRMLTERYADTNELAIVCTMRGDAQPIREEAFVIVDNIITA
jgi:HK97 family phage major capsid protein